MNIMIKQERISVARTDSGEDVRLLLVLFLMNGQLTSSSVAGGFGSIINLATTNCALKDDRRC